MRTHRIACPVDKAEGDCAGYPYNTELASINGVRVHLWMRGDADDRAKVDTLAAIMCAERDVVRVSYSDGEPTGYWAHQDVGQRLAARWDIERLTALLEVSSPQDRSKVAEELQTAQVWLAMLNDPEGPLYFDAGPILVD